MTSGKLKFKFLFLSFSFLCSACFSLKQVDNHERPAGQKERSVVSDIYAKAVKKAEEVSYEDRQKGKRSIHVGNSIKFEAGEERSPLKNKSPRSDKPGESEKKIDNPAVGGFQPVPIVSGVEGVTAGSTSGDRDTDDSEGGSSTTVTIFGVSQINRGEEFSLDIFISNANYVASIPFYFYYDPDLLTFVSASEGSFLNSDGQQTSFITSNDAAKGRLIVGLSRLGDPKGLSGQGSIMQVRLKGVKAGSALTRIHNAMVIGNGGVQTPLSGHEKSIDIK